MSVELRKIYNSPIHNLPVLSFVSDRYHDIVVTFYLLLLLLFNLNSNT
jgi:hypothetical protein